jgi:hypothetical protein
MKSTEKIWNKHHNRLFALMEQLYGSSVLRVLLLIIMVQVLGFDIALSSELKGTICLGKNLAKTASEHSDRLYLKVNNSLNIYFVVPYIEPKIIAQNLDVQRDHTVKVYFDNRVVQSWKLNFFKKKANSVLIWRAAGSWRMEPNDASSCK